MSVKGMLNIYIIFKFIICTIVNIIVLMNFMLLFKSPFLMEWIPEIAPISFDSIIYKFHIVKVYKIVR